MQWLMLLVICLCGGWWLFTVVNGSGGNAIQSVKSSPRRGIGGVLICAIAVFFGLMIIGLSFGKR